MRKVVCLTGFILALGVYCPCSLAADEGLAAWWKFDEAKGKLALDSVSRNRDAIRGNFKYVDGVSGSGIRFDGYTTRVTRKAADAPQLVDAFTVEAWVAPQVYPWNWTAIVNQGGKVASRNEMRAGVAEEQLKPGLFGVRFGSPELSRPEELDELKELNQDWTGQANDWSARWRGYIESAFTGEVTFSAQANNGLRLEIDKQAVVDGWGKDKSRTGKMSMVKGKKYPVILSYYQDGGNSILRLYWSWAGQQKVPVRASALWHTEQDELLAKVEMEPEEAPKELEPRLFFGVHAEGYIGMKLMVNGELQECLSEVKLPLLRWSHIAGTFDKDRGIYLYINGKEVGYLAVKGAVTPATGEELLIGESIERLAPVGTEREASRRTLSRMIFDGLIDEVKIYDRALSASQIAKSVASVKPKTERPLKRRVMPSGPKKVPRRFTAYYTRLRYAEEWEKPWRVGSYPDILVTFDESPVRLVFWRGTSYGANWVTENGIWMGDQSLEDSGTGWGLSEHMADKQCRYSHVRLLENHDARIVVHWRYAVADIRYTINHTNPETGWGDWVDEYYYIYPDAAATRKQLLWTGSDVDGFQWQETIFFSQPGTYPEDNIKMEAFTLANMDGQTRTYSWANGAPEDYPEPKGANIQLTNLKARNRPFIIFEPVRPITAFGSGSRLSKFPWWNHWPVSQIPSDGRKILGPDRPSHSSLSNYEPRAVRGEGGSYIAVSLYGMTEKRIKELAPLARSWNYPAKLKLASSGFESAGYDKYERAYVLTRKDTGKRTTLRFEVSASKESPVVNPAFVIKNWGEAGAKLQINGKTFKRGKDFRYGWRHRLEGSDLIVWIKTESTTPIQIWLSSAEG